REQRTGVLSVHSGVKLRIYFVNGFPILAEGGEFSTALGRMLYECGRIGEEDYERALEEAVKSGRKIGHVLMEMGLVSPHELSEFLEIQLKEKIIRAFGFTQGTFSFTTLENHIDFNIKYEFDPARLLYEGITRFFNLGLLEDVFLLRRGDDPYVEPIQDKMTEVNSLGLPPREVRLARQIKGKTRVGEIIRSSGMGRLETLRILYFLYLMGIVRISELEDEEANMWASWRSGYQRTPVGEHMAMLNKLFDEDDMLGPVVRGEGKPSESQCASAELEGVASQIRDSRMEETDKASPQYGLEEKGSDGGVWFEFETPDGSDASSVSSPSPSQQGGWEEEPLQVGLEREVSDEDLSYAERQHEQEVSSGADFLMIDPSLGYREEDSSSLQASQGESYDREVLLRELNEIGMGSVSDVKQGSSAAGFHLVETPEGPKSSYTEEQQAVIDEILALCPTLDKKNHYEVLGLDRDADIDDIKASFFRLARKFHPDRNSYLEGELREKAKSIFVRVSNAYGVLSDPKLRKEYDLSLEMESGVEGRVRDVYEAEVSYKEGKLLLNQRRYGEAMDCFRRAVELNPEEGEYLAHFAWTKFLVGADRQSLVQETKREIERAIEMSPKCPDSYYFLGILYKQIGETKRAEENFVKAIECDETHAEAKRELWLLRRRSAEDGIVQKPKPKTFWSSLFKR
ncbi:MAG: DnaJ domain-containing protein, partial [Candidatus Methanosuratincola sp.]